MQTTSTVFPQSFLRISTLQKHVPSQENSAVTMAAHKSYQTAHLQAYTMLHPSMHFGSEQLKDMFPQPIGAAFIEALTQAMPSTGEGLELVNTLSRMTRQFSRLAKGEKNPPVLDQKDIPSSQERLRTETPRVTKVKYEFSKIPGLSYIDKYNAAGKQYDREVVYDSQWQDTKNRYVFNQTQTHGLPFEMFSNTKRDKLQLSLTITPNDKQQSSQIITLRHDNAITELRIQTRPQELEKKPCAIYKTIKHDNEHDFTTVTEADSRKSDTVGQWVENSTITRKDGSCYRLEKTKEFPQEGNIRTTWIRKFENDQEVPLREDDPDFKVNVDRDLLLFWNNGDDFNTEDLM